ncbi:hypothetical protein FQN60_015057 [Etheostoma spectabile]|uniref:Chemokine interleukin-8-like domain-containing protein n=2 Tax=Etheostoma spectabile TaxID=54343 RepID=A0A5J5CSE2_9PERO|nr:hypothetical protein FQN60_015057 [Etheostoma spectabile]
MDPWREDLRDRQMGHRTLHHNSHQLRQIYCKLNRCEWIKTVPSVTILLDFTLSRIKSRWHYRRMDMKLLAVVAALTVVIYAPPTQAKPISLVERCYCRSTVNNLPRGYIRELRFIHTPNCPFQVIAKLKSNKEVCVNPEIRWLQQYLKNAINKLKKSKQVN